MEAYWWLRLIAEDFTLTAKLVVVRKRKRKGGS
jgi:hypothetical protein